MATKSRMLEQEEHIMKPETEVLASFAKFLASLTVGTATTVGNLMVYPVFTAAPQANGYLLLEEAVQSGKFTITEVEAGGSVPNLQVTNGLNRDVLLLDGDILVGAKQNRSCTTTILIGKKTAPVIDVNCVERGRWAARGAHFSGGRTHLHSRLRARKSRSVTDSLKRSRGYVADQGEVWHEISMKAASFSTHDARFQRSPTEAADEIYTQYESRITEYAAAVPPGEGQVGFLVLIAGTLVGGDIFGNPAVLAKTYDKSLRSYLLDAVEQSLANEKPADVTKDAKRKAVAFLRSLRTGTHAPFAATGTGTNIRVDGKTVHGFAVLHADQVVHLAAFREAGPA